MDTLNADVPAVFLYSLVNVAAVRRRLDNVEIDPYSWISGLPQWRLTESALAGSASMRESDLSQKASNPSE
jgi:hypothetical protein